MAKAGFTLYGARGKVGNLVARKGEKGTVLSEYVQPGNPRTQGQMRVRVAFGTVAKAGAALSDLVGISFQGETSIRGARRRFNALNISKLARQLKQNIADGTVAPKGMSVLIPNKYIVSDGTIRNATLGNVQVVGDGVSAELQTTSPTIAFGRDAYTAAQLIKMLFGVEPGDQITLVGIKSGLPVEFHQNEMQILRDGAMVSARVYFHDSDVLDTLGTVQYNSSSQEAFIPSMIEMIRSSIKEGYQPFIDLLTKTSFYDTTYLTGAPTVTLDYESALGSPSLSLVLGPLTEGIMAFGYFRSHLNSAGTQWMFSRCELVRIDPVYTEQTYVEEENVNYGLSYMLALSSYLTKSAIETTRYTETGGSDNTLGF